MLAPHKAAGKGTGKGAEALKLMKANPGSKLKNAGKGTWKVIKTAHDPTKWGKSGGIKYDRGTNPWNGFSRKVRGNPDKQAKYPGFNAPDHAAFKRTNQKNAGTKNAARGFVGKIANFTRNIAGPMSWQGKMH